MRGFYPSCDNADEHRREAEDDYRLRGRFGDNSEYRMERHYDDCAAAYMDRFEELKREEDRRREQREQEEQEEERHYRQRQLEQEAQDNFDYYAPGGPFERAGNRNYRTRLAVQS